MDFSRETLLGQIELFNLLIRKLSNINKSIKTHLNARKELTEVHGKSWVKLPWLNPMILNFSSINYYTYILL